MLRLINERDRLQEQVDLKNEMQKLMANRLEDNDERMNQNPELEKAVEDISAINLMLEEKVGCLYGIKEELNAENKMLKITVEHLNAITRLLLILLVILMSVLIYRIEA